jgi:hypothetical protein
VADAAAAAAPVASEVNRLHLVKLGGSRNLTNTIETYRGHPAVAYNSVDNEYMVVWYDGRNGGGADIYGQRVSTDGSAVGSNIAIWTYEASQSSPAIAYNRIDNQYLVVWQTQQSDSTFNGARGRRVAGNGTPLLLTDKAIMSAGTEEGLRQ